MFKKLKEQVDKALGKSKQVAKAAVQATSNATTEQVLMSPIKEEVRETERFNRENDLLKEFHDYGPPIVSSKLVEEYKGYVLTGSLSNDELMDLIDEGKTEGLMTVKQYNALNPASTPEEEELLANDVSILYKSLPTRKVDTVANYSDYSKKPLSD